MGSTEKKSVARRVHIADQPITLFNWYQHINWLNVTFILFVPLIGLISAYLYPAHLYTIIFAVVYYFNAGLGITAGMLYMIYSKTMQVADTAQAITAFGLTLATKPVFLSRSTSPLAVSEPRKGRSCGGRAATARTTATPTRTRIRTRCKRASGTRISGGWC